MTVTKDSLCSALALMDAFPSEWKELDAVNAAARFVERLLPEKCEWCRDGQVEAPITGTDPHGAFASAPHPTCHGTGQVWDEGLVEAVGQTLLNHRGKHWNVQARAVLAALAREVADAAV